MKAVRHWRLLPLLVGVLVHGVGAQAIPQATVDRIVRFTATDGTPLEGKLSIPRGAEGRVPVLFVLHGAGPRNYDHALRYRDSAGVVQTVRYYDYFAWQLAERGMALFRMSKRGTASDSTGRPTVDRKVFSTATPSVLLADYARGLAAVRGEAGVDSDRIVLFGSSEGTRLAPQLALRAPDGIRGLVLTAYAADNSRETVTWQNTVGPWRNVRRLIPAADDDTLTRTEWDAAVAASPGIAQQIAFPALDRDGDGRLTASELAAAVKPRLDAITAAVRDGNDDLIWQAVVNLTSAYLREDWDGPPTVEHLLKVRLPIAIVHGSLDGTTRIEGVLEARNAFQRAGRTDLTVQIHERLDHDLGWTPQTASQGGPLPFREAFDFAARFAGARLPR